MAVGPKIWGNKNPKARVQITRPKKSLLKVGTESSRLKSHLRLNTSNFMTVLAKPRLISRKDRSKLGVAACIAGRVGLTRQQRR
jgi:hypothetical protein